MFLQKLLPLFTMVLLKITKNYVARLQGLGYEFVSETDTEVIAHLVHHELKNS